ncbi:MAG: formate/nitrite transporter family protein [Atribacterota bacterium]|nr:formate/nitrite transporter family protein [Atribacterota bacterium]
MSGNETFLKWCQIKNQKNMVSLFIGGVLAGVYIGFASQLFILVTATPFSSFGVTQLLGGVTFSVGLIMVVLGKADLFTGNCLLLAGCFYEPRYIKNTLYNWLIVYLGNFLGSLFLVFLYTHSGLFKTAEGALAQRTIAIALAKINLTFSEAFVRGLLCNWLVCLAVLFCVMAENNLNRILAIPGPIATFVALGYEHSVANMYFLPAGMMAQKYLGTAPAITWGKAIFINLIPVTLGNIVGGSFFVGFLYWILLRQE